MKDRKISKQKEEGERETENHRDYFTLNNVWVIRKTQ